MVEIIFPESSKLYIDLQCNNAIADYTTCPELSTMHTRLIEFNPKNALELGAGLGRISVFLKKKYKWDNTTFYLLDGNSGDKQIAGLHEKIGNDFYNSLSATREFCLANGIPDDKLRLINLEEPYNLPNNNFDICYSFKAIGFHWPVNAYLDQLYEHLLPGCILIFEVRDTRRESYPTEKHWRRRVNFVNKQLENVDKTKYKILESETNKNNPILVLQRI